jgi:hypothetical protein
MHVRFLPEGPGSRLICSCGVGRDARIVTAAWALFLIIMPLAALGWAVATDDPYERRDMAGAMPLAAVVFLYLATLLGRLMSRGDDTFLLDFVAGRLEARPVGEGA